MGRTAVRAVRPWRIAFCDERCLPASVRGPVECWALERLISSRLIWTVAVADIVGASTRE
jgi:hypothetical protein